MGYMAHHAVLVHAMGYVWDDRIGKNVPTPDVDAFRESLPAAFQPLVIGPVRGAVNGDFMFAFLPDGSKEGWYDSDLGDEFRRAFIELFSFRYDDGSSPFDVVELRFGGDDPHIAWLRDPRGES